MSTTEYGLGINVWYNSTYRGRTAYSVIAALRVPRLVNAVCALFPTNSYLSNSIVLWMSTFPLSCLLLIGIQCISQIYPRTWGGSAT